MKLSLHWARCDKILHLLSSQTQWVSLLLGTSGHSFLSEASLSPEMEEKPNGDYSHLAMPFWVSVMLAGPGGSVPLCTQLTSEEEAELSGVKSHFAPSHKLWLRGS